MVDTHSFMGGVVATALALMLAVSIGFVTYERGEHNVLTSIERYGCEKTIEVYTKLGQVKR